MYDMDNFVKFLGVLLVICVPLAIWKFVEIINWLIMHFRITII